jgi:hypothetical protein
MTMRSEDIGMGFQSILFRESLDPAQYDRCEPPDFFRDLCLPEVIEAITAGFKEYSLATFYYVGLTDIDGITYRQEVMRDLEETVLMESLGEFSDQMRTMREVLDTAQKLFYKRAAKRRFLAGAGIYRDAVVHLLHKLSAFDLKSRGLIAFRSYLTSYIASASFQGLRAEAVAIETNLSNIQFSLLIDGDAVTVLRFNDESDYSAIVEATFEKFRRDINNIRHLKLPRPGEMNHVDAQVLDRVALLFPDAFRLLDDFCTKHVDYLDQTISRFDREIQFYIAYLAYVNKFRQAGLCFCYPQLSERSKDVCSRDAFDIALGNRLVKEKTPIVTNSFSLCDPERILVVSGPNQGGKTTFARMFGQTHYLASLGCLVPGIEANLFLYDKIFTHFEREEGIETLRGKLQDDLIRIRQILDQATPNSIVIMNEIFASTTLSDALYLSKEIMARLTALDSLGVCVTFLDELATFSEKTVSMVGTVDEHRPAVRTFKIERRPANGLAYALALAEKYRVTYDWLRKRLRHEDTIDVPRS